MDAFNYAHGLYADVWSAWAELIINITITIICGLRWGIVGILIGKISSLVAIVVFWKPYYLFSAGFNDSVYIYWKGILRNFAVSACAILSATYLLHLIPINPYQSLINWIEYAIIGMIIFFLIDITLTLLFAKGAKDSCQRILKSIKKNN